MPGITIHTKPYVDHYLKLFFGEKLAVTEETDLGQFFLLRLDNRTNPKGARLGEMRRYTCITKMNISVDLFLRYGGTMTDTNAVKFHQFVERVIKDRMGVYVTAKMEEGVQRERALKLFFQKYNFSEEMWPMESARTELKRFFDRKGRNRMRLGCIFF